MRLTPLVSAIALVSFTGLAGCSDKPSIDPTVQAGAPSILEKVVPAGFTRIELSPYEGNDTHKQQCFVLIDQEAAKQWKGTPYNTSQYSRAVDVGSRHLADAINLTADRENGRWVVRDSDVDPENLDAGALESRLRECMTAFARDAGVSYDVNVTRASIIQHNLQTWTAAIEAGQS